MCKTTDIYLLHFDSPYHHAKHYLGSTTDLERRVEEHRRGVSDVKLMKVVHAAGIGFTLARTWKGDKNRERQLKKQGGLARQCPICKAEARRKSCSSKTPTGTTTRMAEVTP